MSHKLKNFKKLKYLIFFLLFFLLTIATVNSQRQPVVGGDADAWGTIINAYLNVSHDENGSLKKEINASFFELNVTQGLIGQTANFTYLNASQNVIILGSVGIQIRESGENAIFVINDSYLNISYKVPQANNVTVSWDVTGTVAADYEVRIFANSSKNTKVDNSSSHTVTISAGGGDTCTYSSGDWIVDCSDNCLISSEVDVGNNNIYIRGNGNFYNNCKNKQLQ